MKQFQSPDEEDSEESAAGDIKWGQDQQLLFQTGYMADSKAVL